MCLNTKFHFKEFTSFHGLDNIPQNLQLTATLFTLYHRYDSIFYDIFVAQIKSTSDIFGVFFVCWKQNNSLWLDNIFYFFRCTHLMVKGAAAILIILQFQTTRNFQSKSLKL